VTSPDPAPTTLTTRETIQATPERLFELWTKPDHLLQWFGPDGATCVDPQVDLKVGGRYRIGNRFPDGTTLWITGIFELIEKSSQLIYSWGLEPAPSTERVTVRFEPKGDATEVIVVHENIAGAKLRDGHEKGWKDCLKGLIEYVGQ
jgi:uncharacterized protein YndB with AHSA1/START domain